MAVSDIEVANDRLTEFCRRNGFRRLALFGSVLTDRFPDTTDVVVLIEFEPGQRVDCLRLAAMERAHGGTAGTGPCVDAGVDEAPRDDPG